MQIAQTLAGFTASEADILRRAMGKKKKSELDRQKERFINGAIKNGIKKKLQALFSLKLNHSHSTDLIKATQQHTL